MSTPTQNDLWNRVQRLEAELASTKGTDWSKMNRLEMDLAERDRKIRELEATIAAGPQTTCPVCGVSVATPPVTSRPHLTLTDT